MTVCFVHTAELVGSTGDILEKLIRIKISNSAPSQELHDHHLPSRKHLQSDRFSRRVRSLHGRGSMCQNKIESGVSNLQRRGLGCPPDKDFHNKNWSCSETSPYACESFPLNLCELLDLDPSANIFDFCHFEMRIFSSQVRTTAQLPKPEPRPKHP